MKERLSNIIQNAVGGCAKYWADLIAVKLINEGAIVPPCKVGQTVYCIRYNKARQSFVKPLGVLSITTYGKGRFTVFTTKEDTWGITAFATAEEAEKVLKGARNEPIY